VSEGDELGGEVEEGEEGSMVGCKEGASVGKPVGWIDGETVGFSVGWLDGAVEGMSVIRITSTWYSLQVLPSAGVVMTPYSIAVSMAAAVELVVGVPIFSDDGFA